MSYPGFLIMCDHGVEGGPRCVVDRWRWLPEQGCWWPIEDHRESRLNIMYGDEPAGLHPERVISGHRPGPGDPPARNHHEIACPATGCTQWDYRADDNEVQALLGLIVTDDRFLTSIPRSVNPVRIVVMLAALRAARDTAALLGLLEGDSC